MCIGLMVVVSLRRTHSISTAYRNKFSLLASTYKQDILYITAFRRTTQYKVKQTAACRGLYDSRAI